MWKDSISKNLKKTTKRGGLNKGREQARKKFASRTHTRGLV